MIGAFVIIAAVCISHAGLAWLALRHNRRFDSRR